MREHVVVVGLGEVGAPLLELASERFEAIGVDVSTPERSDLAPVGVLHVCFPFEIDDFVGETARYIELFQPDVTVINSTIAVGTTRAVHGRTGAAVAHSPVRGKHARMFDELRSYTKFVGGIDEATSELVSRHFDAFGIRTRNLSSPEATELAKLTETTYFGLLIAWAQELERYCDSLDQDYGEVVSFYDEISFFPPVTYFPGVIGGHCVMPNIELLSRLEHTDILEAIKVSNEFKIGRESSHTQ